MAEATLANAAVGFDRVGRLPVIRFLDGELKTNDPSLSSVAFYEELLEEGHLVVDATLDGDAPDRAAAALGGTADKEGKVTVDVVVYLTASMQVPKDANPAEVPLPILARDARYYGFRGFLSQRPVTYHGRLGLVAPWCWTQTGCQFKKTGASSSGSKTG